MTSNSGEDRKVEGERRRLRLINNSRAEIEEKKSGIGISGKRGEYELMNFETKDFFFFFFESRCSCMEFVARNNSRNMDKHFIYFGICERGFMNKYTSRGLA